MSGARPRTLMIDFLAARTGGQLTRAHAFLGQVRNHDQDTRIHLLHSNGALQRADAPGDLTMHEVHFATPGIALRRVLWQNTRLPALLRHVGATGYLTFSHDLSLRFPVDVPAIVGVSNLAPFSSDARAAESRLSARLRLDILARTIVSSACRARCVIALSETCRSVLIERGVDGGKIEVIPNGVQVQAGIEDAAARDRMLARFGIRGGYLLYVSHFYRYKNFERLVRAFAALDPARRRALQLVLVGRPWDGEYHREVTLLAERLGVAASTCIINGASGVELSTLYASAQLFVFPSLIENSPNILLEAMAHGVPVVASNVAPMPEFGGDAIDYFDASSVDSIRLAIQRALSDPEPRHVTAHRTRARAALFTWERFTSRVVSLYRSVLE